MSAPATTPSSRAGEDRIGKIGSSDIAAVLGRNPYQTPYQAWERITGRAMPEDDNPDLRRGKVLEAGIAELYALEHHVELEAPERLVHPTLPWLHATIDRIAHPRAGDTKPWVVEIKAPRSLGAWRDGVPEMYRLQVVHQIAIARQIRGDINQRADVAALCGALRVYEVELDIDEVESMWARVEEWYDRHVRADTPPPKAETIDHRGKIIVGARAVEPAVRRIAEALEERRKQRRKLEDEIDTLTEALKDELGSYRALHVEGRVFCTLSEYETSRIDAKRLRAEFPDAARACTKVSRAQRLNLEL